MRFRVLCGVTATAIAVVGPDVASRLVIQADAAIVPTRQVVGGVVVLTHRADAFARAPQWSIAPTPLVTAGGPDAPDYDLTRAQYVELLSDGRLVTLAPVGNRLLVFGPDGNGEKSLGRRGSGPGEIMAPDGMSRLNGDTLVIPDGGNHRINWLVATKGFVASKPMPSVRQGGFLRSVGVLRRGELVMSTAGWVQQGVADSVTRPSASVVIVSPKAESATIVASIPDMELLRLETKFGGRPGTRSTPLLFTRRATAVAWDTVIATGSGDGYRIDLRDTKGAVRSTLRVEIARRPVTKAMRDTMIASALRRLDEPHSEGMVDPAESRRLEQIAPAADSLPPYETWFVTPNRTLWVLDAVAPGDAKAGATAFRQDGAIIARLTYTNKGYPVAFGDDRVVMRQTDADGVVSLQVFRILKAMR